MFGRGFQFGIGQSIGQRRHQSHLVDDADDFRHIAPGEPGLDMFEGEDVLAHDLGEFGIRLDQTLQHVIAGRGGRDVEDGTDPLAGPDIKGFQGLAVQLHG